MKWNRIVDINRIMKRVESGLVSCMESQLVTMKKTLRMPKVNYSHATNACPFYCFEILKFVSKSVRVHWVNWWSEIVEIECNHEESRIQPVSRIPFTLQWKWLDRKIDAQRQTPALFTVLNGKMIACHNTFSGINIKFAFWVAIRGIIFHKILTSCITSSPRVLPQFARALYPFYCCCGCCAFWPFLFGCCHLGIMMSDLTTSSFTR